MLKRKKSLINLGRHLNFMEGICIEHKEHLSKIKIFSKGNNFKYKGKIFKDLNGYFSPKMNI